MAYADEVLADSPRLYLRLGESPGATTAVDSSGLSHDGTYVSTPTIGVPGLLGTDANTAVTFASASGEWVNGVDHADLDLGDTVTCEAWIRLNSLGANQGIICKGTNTYYMRVNSSNRLQLIKTAVADIVPSTITLTTGVIYHVAATKATSTVKLYVDGVDVTGTVTNQTLTDSATAYRVGGETSGTEAFNGTIDEAAVYATALSQARIQAHFAAGTVAWPPDGTEDAPETVRLARSSIRLA
jgi:hypothetical protein